MTIWTICATMFNLNISDFRPLLCQKRYTEQGVKKATQIKIYDDFGRLPNVKIHETIHFSAIEYTQLTVNIHVYLCCVYIVFCSFWKLSICSFYVILHIWKITKAPIHVRNKTDYNCILSITTLYSLVSLVDLLIVLTIVLSVSLYYLFFFL